jgi:hypothetical protein
VRSEGGWPASTDPTADSIEPPISGGKPADATAADPATPGRRPTILLRWRCLTTIEAAMPELPDLNAPKFAPIKARFARAYLEHKADLGVPDASDEAVLARVDDITAILFASSVQAWRTDDPRWKERYGWFAAIMSELLDELPGKALDG